MAWLELTLRMRAESYPQAEPLLELAGALSIALTDDGDTPILEPEPGTAPLWPVVTVRALFEPDVSQSGIRAMLAPVADADPDFDYLDDDALAAAEPIRAETIGPRLVIVPADELAATDRRSVGLHMGLAFGTGQHPTTRLCLEWIEREMPAGLSVLDYGAGSGVLALAALKLGAISATAIDNDPQALIATARNATLNGWDQQLTIGAPDSLAARRFDLILANILARPLIELADEFASRQSGGGLIVLSGVLASQLDDIESVYAAAYEGFERRLQDGWGVLAARRKGYDS